MQVNAQVKNVSNETITNYESSNVTNKNSVRSSTTALKINNNGLFGFRALPLSNAHFYFYGGTTKRHNVNGNYTPELTFELYCNDPRIFPKAGRHISFFNTPSTSFVDIEVRNCYQISDENTKNNISNIDNGLNKVLQLRGVTYNWVNDNSDIRNAGLIAQEVEAIIPEVVYSNDSNDFKLLSYTGLIPYLIEAIKEQQLEIEQSRDIINSNDVNKTLLSNNNLQNSDLEEKDKALLYQNNPNPFIENTNIKYYIPNDAESGSILIFNLYGNLLRTIDLYNKGFGDIIINGGDFEPGMYIYSLIVNGKEVDTKRMILTD